MVAILREILRAVAWIGLGLLIGMGAGLLLGWVVWPLEFTEADPTILEDSYQHDYTVMIASAYALDGDINLARRRLGYLGMDDINAWLLSVTVDHILAGNDEVEIRHLVDLAGDMGLYSPAMDPYLPESGPAGEG